MKTPFRPADEARRLEVLRQYDLLDTLPEQSLDDLTALAAQICAAPISLLSVIDEQRQWFKSRVGLSASETPREISFCGHTILQRDLLLVPDAALDERFAGNPLVTGDPHIRFYAGVPLVTAENQALGTLCVIDREPRQLSPSQQEALRVLGRQAMAQLELRRQTRDLSRSEHLLRTIIESEPECVKLLNADGSLRLMNPAGLAMLEAESLGQVAGHCVYPLIVPEHRAQFQELTARVFRGESGSLEFQITGLKGGHRWLESHATPLRDESGKIIFLLGITRDITARKQAEAIVACQTRVLEMIATGLPLATTLTTLLRDTEVCAPGMLGSVLLLDDDGRHLRHGAAPSLPDAFNRAIDGQPIGPAAGSCGTAAFRRETVIVEDIATDPLWADYRDLALAHGLRACWSTPILDEQRRVLGTFAIYYRAPGRPTALHRRCIDLATSLAAVAISRTRAEAALRVSESRHRRLVESNIIGVMIANTDGRISEANDLFLRMVGYTREDLEAGRVRWDAMTPPEWRAVDEHILRELQATGTCAPVEKEYLRKDGTRLPILASVAMLEGTPDACICLIEDLTARKQAEQKILAQLDELRRWQDVMLGREGRVLELKAEVNALLAAQDRPDRYARDHQP